MKKCVICKRPRKPRSLMCSLCCASYDRYGYGDGTVMAAMEWAAKRARRFAPARRHGGQER